MSIHEWFSEGNLAHQIFRVIAAVGLLMAVLQIILRLLGLDHHDVDFHSDGSVHETHIVSWTTLSGFALGFGSVGSLLLHAKYNIGLATLGGALSGLVVGGAFVFLMRAFSLLKEDNTFDIQNSVGKIGTAYIHIPARQSGGQIQVVAQSRLVTLSALSDEAISSGEKVKVLEVVGADTVKVARAS